MIGKKASVKAIAYAEKKSGQQLAKNANWETVFDILMEGYTYSVYSKSEGDTVVKLFEEATDKQLETFIIPNSEVFFDNEWDWSYIFKTIIEWMMKSRKGTKKVKLSQKQIAARITQLREIIKSSKGSEKRKAIKEYNNLSKQVVAETKAAPAPAVPTIKELRKQRSKLCMKIAYSKKLGRPTEELEKQLEELRKTIKNYKAL